MANTVPLAKLFRIDFKHYSPKDGEAGVKCWAIADDEHTVMREVDKRFNYDIWQDWARDGDTVPVYDDEDNEVGTELRVDRLFRLRGEVNDPDASVDDAYYGVIHLGWSEPVEISDSDAAVLLRLGIVEDWR